MKYGNFVREKNFALSDEEEAILVRNIQENLINKYNLPLQFAYVETLKDKVAIHNNAMYIYLNAKPGVKIQGRNKDKERVLSFEKVGFIVTKSSGYLDVTDWNNPTSGREKDYDNAPKYQYHISIDIRAEIIGYKQRNKRSMYIEDFTDYGTEFSDFDWDKWFKSISDKLTIVSEK